MRDGIKNFLNSALGLLLIVIACFFAISYITYTPIDIYSPHQTITFNSGGVLGSIISNFCFQYFGLSAILIPINFLLWGVVLFYRHKLTHPSLRISVAFLSIIILSFILGNFNSLQNILSFPLGGYVGYMLNKIAHTGIFFLPIYISCLTLLPFLVIFSTNILEFIITKSLSQKILILLKKLLSFTKPSPSQKLQESNSTNSQNQAKLKNPLKQNNPTFSNIKTSNVSQSPTRIPHSKGYIPPEINFLAKNSNSNLQKQQTNLKNAQKTQNELKQVLLDFGVEGEIVSFSVGPVITMYEFEPKAGTRSSRVIGLSDDIARSLKAKSARISIIPEKSSLAIEIPNDEREIVYFRELVEDKSYNNSIHNLPLCLGKDISGKPIIVDLAKMPHLLVAGTTGSGKSIGINSMIMSLLYKLSPEDCKLIMIDPKMLELSVYEGIPHLMTPVVTDPEKAALTLQWVTKEMEARYKTMSKIGVRNIVNYNLHIKENSNQNHIDSQSFSPSTNENDGKKMPYIVVIVDEMADLMLTAGKTVEASIQRLAQMARAAGIHIIMATQRPSVDVITGIIKANFPTRISFQVTSKIDSRTILGYQGAEGLLGMGDMLYMPTGGKTYRIHSPFVDDKEVAKVVHYLKENYPNESPNYEKIANSIESDLEKQTNEDEGDGNIQSEEDLYSQAVAIVKMEKKASISYIQRRFRIGYNKAANLIERMEEEGIVSLPDHQGKRIVIEGNQ